MKGLRQDQADGWQEAWLLAGQKARRGFGFGETVGRGASERARIRGLGAVLVVGMIGLSVRTSYLTLIEKGKHLLLSDSNSVMQVRELAERGKILDRDNRALTVNELELGERGRQYPLGSAAAHLTGYIAEVTPDELGCREGLCYTLGDWIGRSGAEKVFEASLRGRDGGRIVERDATGQRVRDLGGNSGEPGQDVVLSIDARLQQLVAEAIGEREGSVVALSMQGKVLALYSGPSYDPNVFTVQSNEEQKKLLLSNKEKEYFLDRAIGGVYPPGSVFKLVTAYAGLETGRITPETLIEDTGEIRIDEYRYGNWYFDQYGQKEGELDLGRALARSNDIYFYKVGELVGVDELVRWARKFGLGVKTGIELPGEVEGLVPGRLWKERITGERWFLGNTYHLAIGQGDLTTTPLQVARMTLAAVTGRRCETSVLKDSPIECEELGLESEHIEVVRAGMRAVCAPGGTAFPFFDFAPYVLCKTGTAQHGGQVKEEDLPHAWMVVAYPGENPEMILTVMLPSAGEGSYEAAPVAREILDKWKTITN